MDTLAIACLWIALADPSPRAASASEPPIVDIHTHVFNAKYLPLGGIFYAMAGRRWGTKRITAGAASLVLAATKEADLSVPPRWRTDLSLGLDADASIEEISDALVDRLPFSQLDRPAVREGVAELRALLLDDLRTAEAELGWVERLERAQERGGGGEAEWLSSEQGARARAIQQRSVLGFDGPETELAQCKAAWVDFERALPASVDAQRADLASLGPGPWLRGSAKRLLRKAWKLMNVGPDFVSWVHLLTRDELWILNRLRADHSRVDLFVHHMMDMEHPYADAPMFDFPTAQIQRMRRLVQLSDGRLVTFVAWDPDRVGGLQVVKNAVASGAVGVKVYPPSGYLPDDPRNDPLYAWCADEGVPVFTHCTPEGFEVASRAGLNSDPTNWRPVMRRHEDLILCLGHAGGDNGWFAADDAGFRGSYAWRAVQLSLDHESVYLGFGYLHSALDPDHGSLLRERLSALVRSEPRIARRIMYGTDWHMTFKEHDQEDFVQRFREVFDNDALRAHRDSFFRANAVRYLNLERYATKHGSWLGPAAVAHLRRVAAGG